MRRALFGRSHSLGFQEQVAEVLVSAPAVDRHSDVAVDGLHHAEPYFGAALVENPIQVTHQHGGQFLNGEQALPAEPIHPGLQVAHRRAFAPVIPEMFRRLLQQVSLHHSAVEFEQGIEELFLLTVQVDLVQFIPGDTIASPPQQA